MNVPYGWLRELVENLPDPAATAELLDGLGLAVEALHERPAAPAGVVVARIERADAIEGSDHLLRTVVFDGAREHVVVCGAPNAAVGVHAALALPGTHLPAAGLDVGRREMLGVPSEGMLCSPKELGLFDHAGGLLVLGEDLPLGTPLEEAWPAETVLELELTPNRADAFSLLGVARDLAAKLGSAVRDPSASDALGDRDGKDGLSVQIEDADGCPHLVLQRIDGVRVTPSPAWLQRRLAALGLRPRNAVVDATNYVTYELGQPSHAYDRRVLEGGVLQVRPARQDESVTLLDGETRLLDPSDMTIATPGRDDQPSKAVGLAGVMGGLHDSVRRDTDSVALEVAHFDPVRVRTTAKRHGLHTDAHLRFERGVDPALPPRAAARCARLIAELTGGTVHPAVSVAGGATERAPVAIRPSRVGFLMGFEVPPETQARYLTALGCEVQQDESDAWTVVPPSWRFDLSIEEDLIEEVARLHGYEHIGRTRPDLPFTPERTDPTHRALRDELAAAGLTETIAYVFTGDEELARARAPQAVVALANPQGIERARLRTALHPGLLAAAATNRHEPDLALFEIGRVFGFEERERLGLLASGAWERGGWREGTPVDLWRLKGLLEGLAERRRASVIFRPAREDEAPMLHPGVAAVVTWNDREIGVAGRLHPEVQDAYGLPETYLAELDLPLDAVRLTVGTVPRQPYAERDLAILAPQEVPYAHVERTVRDAAGERLVQAFPFDVYQGAPLEEGIRSVAFRLRWRHPERALRDAEVDAWLGAVVAAVRAEGYAIRE
ncbi:MAG: phenylalanine--tRNA ligase subunit beta [Trueperaceae bacterium]